MAKNNPADNQFAPQEKYLARIIAARWTSLPTVGPNEPGLMIQVKLMEHESKFRPYLLL